MKAFHDMCMFVAIMEHPKQMIDVHREKTGYFMIYKQTDSKYV